jgi:hypothetical protein
MNALSALATLTPGDIVTVRFDGGERTVHVESVINGAAYTTGGKVRPGRIAGGRIYDIGGDVYFQPTMAQQTRAVVAIEKMTVN